MVQFSSMITCEFRGLVSDFQCCCHQRLSWRMLLREASIYVASGDYDTSRFLSVCQKCEQAIGFIVSQDGEVKAVKAAESKLFFWDGILD